MAPAPAATLEADFRLETERLVLRPMVMSDLGPLAAMLGDPEHMRWYPAPKSLEEARNWIRWVRRGYRTHGLGLWAMELKDGGGFAGQCGVTLQDVDREQLFELGWHTRRDLWGRGLAVEAARACRAQAFDRLPIDRLISLVRPENVQSCRVAEKLGMTVSREAMHSGFLHRVYAIDRSTSGSGG
jgi:RimJ/RimL family protein N-acetyltransferase